MRKRDERGRFVKTRFLTNEDKEFVEVEKRVDELLKRLEEGKDVNE